MVMCLSRFAWKSYCDCVRGLIAPGRPSWRPELDKCIGRNSANHMLRWRVASLPRDVARPRYRCVAAHRRRHPLRAWSLHGTQRVEQNGSECRKFNIPELTRIQTSPQLAARRAPESILIFLLMKSTLEVGDYFTRFNKIQRACFSCQLTPFAC